MKDLHSNRHRLLRLAAWPVLLAVCVLMSSLGLAAAKHQRGAIQSKISRGKCVSAHGKRISRSSARPRRGHASRRCPTLHQTPEAPDAPSSKDSPDNSLKLPPGAPVGPPPIREGGTEPEEPTSGSIPISAKAENFAGQPSDVLLTYGVATSPSDASQCEGLGSAGQTVDFGGIGQGPGPKTIRLELVPGGSMPAKVRCTNESEDDMLTVSVAAPSAGGMVDDPIDSKYLTQLPFGRRSFWIQPWRAYLDTWPASRLLDSVGINFNVKANEADGTARLLQHSGFKLARIEIGWNAIAYDDPNQFVNEPNIRERFVALRDHGLRPLILLNANSGSPGPTKSVTLATMAAAPAGAESVELSSTSAAEVIPGKTGFNNLSFGGAPDLFITSVDANGVASLSRPLPGALAAGAHNGSTLRYAPFGKPLLSNGDANPAFRSTLAGWLRYVATICHEADDIFGAGGYDLEVWNELSFGSEFLDQKKYYSPPRESGSGSATEALLDETVAYIRDPANGISPDVGVSDGFASQTPFASGGSVPLGTTALSKHLYSGPRYFPRNETVNSILPLNALGGPDATTTKAPYIPRYTPSYTSALPEYFLAATQTETAIRDLAPMTTSIYGVSHGRNVGLDGSSPPETWMTEYNLNTNTLFPLSQAEPDRYMGTTTEAEKERLQAEVVLRSLVSMASKGMARVYFYAAAHADGYSLISDTFINTLNASPTTYPGDQFGGDTMDAVRNLIGKFGGPGPGGAARRLELRSIAQEGNHAQFAGDGTAAHPDLYDRDLLAVFPFQSSPTRVVIPVYVMTSNLTTVYPGSSNRFDLPDENFRITLGNLPETTSPPAVSAYDPIRAAQTPARFVSRRGDRAVFEVAATNYPRVLTIDFVD
jgi:hypothetical protein